MNLPELLGFYMTEKHMDDITLADKCGISPMNIVNIKKAATPILVNWLRKSGAGWI